jgi:hypothetical protein
VFFKIRNGSFVVLIRGNTIPKAYKARPAIIKAKNRRLLFNRAGMLEIIKSMDDAGI